MAGCSKSSAGAVSGGLPDDPLVEILSRVPAKSVCRFKCVSKAWRDLIADPDHRKRLRQAMQGLFIQAPELSELDGISFVGFGFSFIDLTVRSVPLDIDPSFSFVTEFTRIKTSFFLDSCNGLILFVQRPEPSHASAGGYIVCNPTTKQWLEVPASSGSRAATSHTYLAFDPAVSSHFHLVQFQMSIVDKEILLLHVYSSETGTWSQNQIHEQNEQAQLEGWRHQVTVDAIYHRCAFVNGFLHLMVWGSDGKQILAVDVQGKARMMNTPPGGIYYLGQSQGHLHCMSADEKSEKLSMWVIQDYGTQQWVLKNTVELSIFGESCARETLWCHDFQVVDIHQDCNVVFFFQSFSCDYKLTAYDMDRKELSVIGTFKHPKFQSDFARYVPYFSESLALTNK